LVRVRGVVEKVLIASVKTAATIIKWLIIKNDNTVKI
jgi:hypothetical protein